MPTEERWPAWRAGCLAYRKKQRTGATHIGGAASGGAATDIATVTPVQHWLSGASGLRPQRSSAPPKPTSSVLMSRDIGDAFGAARHARPQLGIWQPDRKSESEMEPKRRPWPSDFALGGVWIVDDFPKMSIRVAEVAGVDAPGPVVNFGYWCPGCLGFGKQRVDLLPSCYCMAETELTAPRRPGWDARVFGEFRARVEGEDLPTRELEHDDCACRVRVVAAMLGCYDAGRLKTECSVEGECSVEVGHGIFQDETLVRTLTTTWASTDVVAPGRLRVEVASV